MGISKEKLQNSSKQVIQLSQKSNRMVAQGMVELNREATKKLGAEMIELGTKANRDMAETTSAITERAVRDKSQSLIRTNERLADELSDYLAKANQEAAGDVSRRLMGELEREPLVNFRVLAQIMAQTFAGGKLTDRREAYITVIDKKGTVLASTRYKRDSSLAKLDIVKHALNDPAKVASEMPLLTYKDGSDSYLGVYARKADGGAVIVAYNLEKAQEDLKVLGKSVNTSFENLVKITTNGTRQAVTGTTPLIKREADAQAKLTIAALKKESDRLSSKAAAEMTARATKTSQGIATEITRESEQMAAQSAVLMQNRSQEILRRAIAEMAPIGKRYAKQAADTMTPQAEKAVGEIKSQLQPQIHEASLKAAEKMLPEAQIALQESRAATFRIGIGILFAAILFGLIVSYFLSKKIADPVEVEKKLQEAELSRMGKEMEIATQIQTALLPRDFTIQNSELSMELVTATEVGGDLIDYIPREDGGFWLAVGDVTGHGLTPGLVMMMAQTTLTSQVLANPKAMPSDVLVQINQTLYNNVKFRLGNDNYMTLQLIRHEGNGRFIAAGMHCDILIFRNKTRSVERIEVPGFWTGLVPDVADMTTNYGFELQPGDILLLYTDGLIEAMNEQQEQYDIDRLQEALIRNAELPLDDLKANILREVQDFLHVQNDDISIIALRWTGVTAPTKIASVSALN
ncbi:MAG: PP2C family protein-serine/threonine phosphatase, partial [Bacteroidota bacterium]